MDFYTQEAFRCCEVGPWVLAKHPTGSGAEGFDMGVWGVDESVPRFRWMELHFNNTSFLG